MKGEPCIWLLQMSCDGGIRLVRGWEWWETYGCEADLECRDEEGLSRVGEGGGKGSWEEEEMRENCAC